MICHHHKCVFVHIPKNAGQSVEHVFLRLVGLSWEKRAPLLMRYNANPELGPPRLSHLTARQYVECGYLSSELFESYFKFGVVRNPWDRMVSMYKYFGYQRICGFKEFVCREFGNDLWRTMRWFVCPQIEYLCDKNGDLMVDFVGRYEALQADFHEVCMRLGLPPTDLPHVNDNRFGQARADTTIGREIKKLRSYPWWLLRGRSMARVRRPYVDYYDDDSREYVAELYRSDIERFGYSFGEAEPPARTPIPRSTSRAGACLRGSEGAGATPAA